MNRADLFQHLISNYDEFRYIRGFSWYKHENGFMVQTDPDHLYRELLNLYFDEHRNLRQGVDPSDRVLNESLKLFEKRQGLDCNEIVGNFIFRNQPKELFAYLSRIEVDLSPRLETKTCEDWSNQVYPQNPRLIKQIGGYILFHPNNDYQKVFLITGPGGNGKGTFLRIFISLLENKVSGLPLACSVDFDDFGKHERFEIIGKTLVYDSDISGNAKSQRWIKIISGGDKITASKKFQQPVTFYPRCKVMLLSNPIPEWQSNPALLRRIVHLRFKKRFKIDPVAEAKLLTAEMLEQWVAYFYQGYQDFMNEEYDKEGKIIKHAGGFSLIEENNAGEFLSEADDLAAFFQDWCTFGDQHEIPTTTLYNKFKDYWVGVLQETKLTPNSRVIGKRLKELGVEKLRNQTLTKQQCDKWGLLFGSNHRYDVYKGITLNDYL